MKKILLILSLFLSSSLIFAQNEETKEVATTFAGSADLYYKYDFSKSLNGLTSFTNSHNSFELGMASIEANHTMGKASVFVDLGFGTRVQEFNYNDANTKFMIKQLYVTYEVADNIKITAGSFGTHIGYELLDAVDNKNYSMSYAFSYGPFFNTGVKAHYTVGKVSFMGGVTNATDFKSALDAGSTQKTFIGQVAYAADFGSAFLNFTSGSTNPVYDENKTQIDFVGTKTITDKFSVSLNATYAMTKNDFDSALDGEWFSIVGYASYLLKDNLILAYRMEYFDAKDSAATLGKLTGSNVFANTISLNYKVGNLTVIPELRLDAASEDVFVDKELSPTGIMAFGLIAATCSF